MREGRPVDGTLGREGEGFLEAASAEEVVAVGGLDGFHEGAAAVERGVSCKGGEVGKRERGVTVPADGTLECSGDWIDIVIVVLQLVHVTHLAGLWRGWVEGRAALRETHLGFCPLTRSLARSPRLRV